MADSIQEQMLKKIAAALANAVPTGTVQRFNQDGVNLAAVPTILLKEGEVSVELGLSVAPSIMRRMELFAVVIDKQDVVNDSRSGGEILNAMTAAVEEILAANRTWSGLAVTTDPPTYLEVDLDSIEPHLSRGLRFEVQYEHIRVNPYAQQ